MMGVMKAEFQEFKQEMRIELKEWAMTITETILEGMDRVFQKLSTRMDTIDDRLGVIEKKVSNIEGVVLEMRDDLDAGLKAIDKHSIQLMDHTKRIGRIEKRIA